MTTTPRTISPKDVEQALMFIRDTIITDENLTTFFSVIQKTSAMFESIYFGITGWFDKNEHPDELKTLATQERKLIDSLVTIIQTNAPSDKIDALQHILVQEEKSRSISMTGVLEALHFIISHVKTSGDILNDIYKIMEAVSKVRTYAAPDGNRSMKNPTTDGDLLAIYRQLTVPETASF